MFPLMHDETWRFKTDTNGRWIWLRYSAGGVPLATSRANYAKLQDCIADAEAAGYCGTLRGANEDVPELVPDFMPADAASAPPPAPLHSSDRALEA